MGKRTSLTELALTELERHAEGLAALAAEISAQTAEPGPEATAEELQDELRACVRVRALAEQAQKDAAYIKLRLQRLAGAALLEMEKAEAMNQSPTGEVK